VKSWFSCFLLAGKFRSQPSVERDSYIFLIPIWRLYHKPAYRLKTKIIAVSIACNIGYAADEEEFQK
jgi:hypothetical protein